jgi:hypothetical protein
MRTRFGFNVLELLFITALLLLFGVTTYTLISVGSENYRRVMDKRDVNSNLRIALSYVTNQVHRYDEQGAISLREEPEGTMLVIATKSGEERYEIRVYLYNGILYEGAVPAEEPFDPIFGDELTALSGLRFEYVDPADKQNLLVTAWDGDAERRRTSSILLHLHAAPGKENDAYA